MPRLHGWGGPVRWAGGAAARMAAGAVALALLGTACERGGRQAAEPVPSRAGRPTATTTTTEPREQGPPAPLTGLPLDDGVDAGRPAVVVKVDNDPRAWPQAGLDDADVVIEERVEGSVVRFLAVFHSHDAEWVGPVRSVRSTDAAVVAPIGGVFAYAGGIPAFEAMARRAPVTVVSESRNADAFKYRSGRHRPFKTFVSTASLRKRAADDAKAPPGLFGFLPEGSRFNPPGSTPASRAVAVFGSLTTATWDYSAAHRAWKRTTNGQRHIIEGGEQLAFTNVVLQFVPYRRTRYRDRSDYQVDEAVLVGRGEAVVLSGGRQLRAKWSKPSANAVTTFTDAGGAPLRLSPGTTWVSLVPVGAKVTVSSEAREGRVRVGPRIWP